ncbi:MAG: PH domain-containing protein [Patescibacteria group bacterium]|nr:hypothetical protein [Patescibacteria group bacterium]MBU2509106.1 hypothetical protein [Patescibacteria group bacterium]
MFHIEDVLQLKDIEETRSLVRHHPLTLFPSLGLATLLIVVPFFFIFPLFSWGVPGMLVFLAAVIVGVVMALRIFLLWNSNVLIVTSLRLVEVDQRGVFSRFVTEIPLSLVRDISYVKKGFKERVFHMGTITIKHGEEPLILEVTRVAHPERIMMLINDLRAPEGTKPEHEMTDVRLRTADEQNPDEIDVTSPERGADKEVDPKIKDIMEKLGKLPKEALAQVEQAISEAAQSQVGMQDSMPFLIQKELGVEEEKKLPMTESKE